MILCHHVVDKENSHHSDEITQHFFSTISLQFPPLGHFSPIHLEKHGRG